ncbi:hypothetical protein IAE30_27010 [Pantoea sp. S61]|uniref:hypothetical protein n=1 Tax=Pantoea sp. S61 TaxID=2767442 RepID=UPI00190CA59D|nr:hypothetical protein [Pantoea sp. S61]MBK0127399.1 hypothetical protein [Pantoea sp. S61]
MATVGTVVSDPEPVTAVTAVTPGAVQILMEETVALAEAEAHRVVTAVMGAAEITRLAVTVVMVETAALRN